MRHPRHLLGLALLIGAAGCFPPQRQPDVPPVTGYIAQPALRPFNEALLSELRVPAGFAISVFAQDLGNPRNLVQAEDGTVLVTRRKEGDVVALKDTDGDGRADQRRVVASGIDTVNGIVLHEGRVYLGPPKQVLVAALQPDGGLATPSVFIDNLPDGGQHPNRVMRFSPDGSSFFVSVGSSCNACDEPNSEHATLLRFRADGTQRMVYARGLRNTIGFDWHPTTGQLWGMDHGSDWRGNDQPPEELNRIEEGKHYGWPYCWDDRKVDQYTPSDPQGTTKAAFCPTTEPPVLTHTAHSAPLGLVFYNANQFPSEYRGDAIVTFRGSWNREPPTGYKLSRIRFENGQPTRFEDFVTGFLGADGRTIIGRPAGLTVARDGSILFADDTNGVIYRVRYRG